LSCPRCAGGSVELIEALSFPPGGSPDRALIGLRCARCATEFALVVAEQGDGTARLTTVLPRD
jgi:hypothetical protein